VAYMLQPGEPRPYHPQCYKVTPPCTSCFVTPLRMPMAWMFPYAGGLETGGGRRAPHSLPHRTLACS
jgi:hypothetical protein